MWHIFRVDLTAQYRAYEDEIRAVVERVLASGRYVMGVEGAAFEEEFAAYAGTAHCVGVADGTRAISMCLRLLDAGPGDEVITTPFTAIPTIGAIMDVGAAPVFVDVDPDTWLMDIDAVPAKITSRTKAVVPVHMFGNPVDVPRLRERIGSGIPIIEDAAQAHGSRLNGRHVGGFGDFGTFSFYPTKNLGGYGDGGAVVTNNGEMAERLRWRRNHGMIDKDVCAEAGVNSRLDEIQAAILRVKLRSLDAMNASRAALVRRYLERLPGEICVPQRTTPGGEMNWHVFQIRYRGDRDGLIECLDAAGIQSNVYYVIPHHLQPALQRFGHKPGDLPVVEALCREVIALPLYPELDPAVVDEIATRVGEFGS